MKKVILACFVAALTACSPQTMEQISRGIQTSNERPLTNADLINGLKEALEKGTGSAVQKVSANNGFLNNPLIRLAWPEEAKQVESTLRNLGFNKLCDDVIASLNKGAERATAQAVPIFVGAIRQMTVSDAMSIIKGEPNAATNFLKRTTTSQLTQAFNPIVRKSLDEVNATKLWGDVATQYNRVPLVKPIQTDLSAYVTEKAINGLFVYIAEKEKDIRQNPLERTTELLKRVFRLQD